MRKDKGVATSGTGTGDDAIRTDADLLHGLAVRPGSRPDRPARVVGPDLRRQATLELPVVPFLQVGVDDGDGTEPGEGGGFAGS